MRRREPRLLPQDRAQALARAPFTYHPVGATRDARELASTFDSPSGFHHLRTRHELGHGAAAYALAARRLMTWGMHAGAGLRVAASSPRVEEAAVVVCGLGPLEIPCRVVWVLEEPEARGFGYGTLPGHPESGEESFVVRREDDVDRVDGVVTLTVEAYSRPGLLVTRLAGPVGRLGQRLMVARYAAALRAED